MRPHFIGNGEVAVFIRPVRLSVIEEYKRAIIDDCIDFFFAFASFDSAIGLFHASREAKLEEL